MSEPQPQTPGVVNGIDTQALFDVMENVRNDPSQGVVSYHVRTEWEGQAKTVARAVSMAIGGQPMDRDFEVRADEPVELLGEDSAANPQELLFAAMNACVMVTYVVGAAVRGITLDSLTIDTEGDLDLRGFLGLDATVKPGYDTITYTVRLSGNGTTEQYQEIHDAVIRTSPNRFNLAMPINVVGKLEIN